MQITRLPTFRLLPGDVTEQSMGETENNYLPTGFWVTSSSLLMLAPHLRGLESKLTLFPEHIFQESRNSVAQQRVSV